ncbi:MAG: hypothetical protein CVU24_03260 [Betaproteobacteria bacterium HGW-Betaproteobacteria-18]|nr:MAG: hypothetical protein CVU24_03260 [Betaproteobacteria bacterium HGW-Betaproteobacteria-18]
MFIFLIILPIGLDAHQSMSPWNVDVPLISPLRFRNKIFSLIYQCSIEAISSQEFPSKFVIAALFCQHDFLSLSFRFAELVG